MRLSRRIVTAATAVAAASVAGTLLSTAAAAPVAARHWQPQTRATSSPGLTDPSTNVAPSPDYWPACQANPASTTCFNAVLTAIDHARSLEGVGPMVLPAGFNALSVAQQTFVVSNLERVDRGLAPAAGMVDKLNSASATAASADADPSLPGLPWVDGSFSGWGYASNWAGDLNALAADYDWMYNDGYTPGGPNYNLDCQSATGSGCWGHRDNILSTFWGYPQVVTGVASTVQSNWTSIAQIFVAGTGTPPSFTTSWAQVNGSSSSATSTVATASAASGTSRDASGVTISAPSTTTSGLGTRVTGHVTDKTTGASIHSASVTLCRHTVLAATTTCSSYTADATGTVNATVKPAVSTVYWWQYGGTSSHAAASSAQAVVKVRPRLTLSAGHGATGWRVTSHLTPARGQVERLQRQTSTGWVTVRRAAARTWLTFGGLRAGTYRVLVSAVSGSLATSARIRAA